MTHTEGYPPSTTFDNIPQEFLRSQNGSKTYVSTCTDNDMNELNLLLSAINILRYQQSDLSRS